MRTWPARLARTAREHPAPLLVLAGYVLLGFAWALATPPGDYPDADAHYIRAIAASRGELVGQPYTGPALDSSRFRLGQARVFTVPAGFAVPATFDCDGGKLNEASVCSYMAVVPGPATAEVSVEGTNSPLGYLLPALAMRLAHGPNGAELLGRLASVATSLALLGAAVALLWSRRTPISPLLGLLFAVTPTVLFLAGAVGPDGLESAATICLVAGLLRLSRDEPLRAWIPLVTAAAACVLAVARPAGFAWVLLDVAACALLFGARRMGAVLAGRAGRAALGITVLGLIVGIAWEQANRLTPVGGLGHTLSFIPGVFDLLPQYIGDVVGRFGQGDIQLPQPLVEPWVLVVVLLAGFALAVGTQRERAVVVVLLVGCVVAVVGYAAAFDSLTDGGLLFAQARHVLPVVLLLPLLIGEVVSRRADRLGAAKPERLFLYCTVVAGAVELGAFYYVARRYAVGNLGSLAFFLPGHAQWSPPTHWSPLLVMAAGGAALLVVAAAADLRQRRGQVRC